ncbi:hypothetical protein LINGRAHAP2_LOCUS3916 [Linum grandiflorum]
MRTVAGLPKYVVLKSKPSGKYLHYLWNDEFGDYYKNMGAKRDVDPVNSFVKLEVVPSTSDPTLVHLRCSYTVHIYIHIKKIKRRASRGFLPLLNPPTRTAPRKPPPSSSPSSPLASLTRSASCTCRPTDTCAFSSKRITATVSTTWLVSATPTTMGPVCTASSLLPGCLTRR